MRQVHASANSSRVEIVRVGSAAADQLPVDKRVLSWIYVTAL